MSASVLSRRSCGRWSEPDELATGVVTVADRAVPLAVDPAPGPSVATLRGMAVEALWDVPAQPARSGAAMKAAATSRAARTLRRRRDEVWVVMSRTLEACCQDLMSTR